MSGCFVERGPQNVANDDIGMIDQKAPTDGTYTRTHQCPVKIAGKQCPVVAIIREHIKGKVVKDANVTFVSAPQCVQGKGHDYDR